MKNWLKFVVVLMLSPQLVISYASWLLLGTVIWLNEGSAFQWIGYIEALIFCYLALVGMATFVYFEYKRQNEKVVTAFIKHGLWRGSETSLD